ncbi:putative DD41D transposase [Trichonephila clavipes]|uniref:Putative DD41D transposase n=1 Tax=Trichonephila clavipes TaxID=2585209 RepID=A0A8X6UYJ8_TRICX|nr:putative DD41D transposase [Trichonephila clavipes]
MQPDELGSKYHVPDLVGRRLTRDPRPAAAKDELLLRIQAIWNYIPYSDIQNLFDSMSRSIAALIGAPHFWLNGYVNKQNCRIWSEANPQVYVETPLHPEKLTVLCALWACGIIGPYFFKNDEGHNVTVNGDRYRAIVTSFFNPELNNHDVQELWFQEDGATCHTTRATID